MPTPEALNHLPEWRNVDAMINTQLLSREVLRSWIEVEPSHFTSNEEENKRIKAAVASLRSAFEQDIVDQQKRIKEAIYKAVEMPQFMEYVHFRDSQYNVLKRMKPQWIDYCDNVN